MARTTARKVNCGVPGPAILLPLHTKRPPRYRPRGGRSSTGAVPFRTGRRTNAARTARAVRAGTFRDRAGAAGAARAGSERDVVVGEAVVEVARRRGGRGRRRGAALAATVLAARRGAALRPVAAGIATLAATAATATEHLHLVGDDLGDVALLAVLAGELVVADRAFHVALRALAQVLAGDLAELAEELHPVPLCALLGVAIAVLAHAGGGQADGGHGHAGLRVLGFGIVAEVA